MALSLKIVINGDTKMLRFMQDMSVHEAIKEIQSKTGVGGDDHGLFQPAGKEKLKRPTWFKETNSLMSYELSNGVIPIDNPRIRT